MQKNINKKEILFLQDLLYRNLLGLRYKNMLKNFNKKELNKEIKLVEKIYNKISKQTEEKRQ